MFITIGKVGIDAKNVDMVYDLSTRNVRLEKQIKELKSQGKVTDATRYKKKVSFIVMKSGNAILCSEPFNSIIAKLNPDTSSEE